MLLHTESSGNGKCAFQFVCLGEFKLIYFTIVLVVVHEWVAD